MIKLENISKSFGNDVILEDLTLEINEGDFISISGESGSGKTTLLNLIGLLEKPDAGTVYIDSKNNHIKDKRMIYRDKIGFLFQHYALLDNLTVSKNLELVTKIKHEKKKKHTEIIDTALLEVGLSPKIKNKKIYQLSGGEQQRVALARLIIQDPKYILADEPTGNLDEFNKYKVFNCLKKLNDSQKTVIFVTHDKELSAMTPRRLYLKNKKIIEHSNDEFNQ